MQYVNALLGVPLSKAASETLCVIQQFGGKKNVCFQNKMACFVAIGAFCCQLLGEFGSLWPKSGWDKLADRILDYNRIFESYSFYRPFGIFVYLLG